MNLKRKLESVLAAYVESLKLGRSPLKSYTVFQASNAEDKKLPSILIEAAGMEEAFPGGPKNVTLEVMVATQIDDNASGELPSAAQRAKVREKHDNALDQINAALDGTTALADLQARLNSGDSRKRLVTGFHLYDITKTDERHAFADRTFIDALSFMVVCEAQDGA